MQYLIMHGSYGSPEENWFRWLEKQLTNQGNTVILEKFPADDWNEVTHIGQEKIDSYLPKESLESWEKVFVSKILPKLKTHQQVLLATQSHRYSRFICLINTTLNLIRRFLLLLFQYSR